MIKNIVFDISNVLAPFRFKEYLIDKGFNGETIKRIYKASVVTPYWTLFEKGKISREEAINEFIKLDPGIKDELHKAYDNSNGIMGKYDYSHSWIDSLKKQGYKLYCISNFTPAGYVECYDCIDFVEKFDGVVLSFKEGYAKPEKEIYEILLNRYDLNPSECVFIDDTKENVEAAINLGFKGIVFKNYEDAVKELNEIIKL